MSQPSKVEVTCELQLLRTICQRLRGMQNLLVLHCHAKRHITHQINHQHAKKHHPVTRLSHRHDGDLALTFSVAVTCSVLLQVPRQRLQRPAKAFRIIANRVLNFPGDSLCSAIREVNLLPMLLTSAGSMRTEAWVSLDGEAQTFCGGLQKGTWMFRPQSRG